MGGSESERTRWKRSTARRLVPHRRRSPDDKGDGDDGDDVDDDDDGDNNNDDDITQEAIKEARKPLVIRVAARI